MATTEVHNPDKFGTASFRKSDPRLEVLDFPVSNLDRQREARRCTERDGGRTRCGVRPQPIPSEPWATRRSRP
jgi:hypothetical protein